MLNFEARLRKTLEDHGATAQDCDMCGPHIECFCGQDFNDQHIIDITKPIFMEALDLLSDRLGRGADGCAMLAIQNKDDERVRLNGKTNGLHIAKTYVDEMLRENQ